MLKLVFLVTKDKLTLLGKYLSLRWNTNIFQTAPSFLSWVCNRTEQLLPGSPMFKILTLYNFVFQNQSISVEFSVKGDNPVSVFTSLPLQITQNIKSGKQLLDHWLRSYYYWLGRWHLISHFRITYRSMTIICQESIPIIAKGKVCFQR